MGETQARSRGERNRMVPIVSRSLLGHITALGTAVWWTAVQEGSMEELNGRMIACQILITGLIARVANEQRDPLQFLSEFRDEIRAVVRGIRIDGMLDTERVRLAAQQTVDEMFSLMKPPSHDEA
ncbi:hypothetical protein LOC51_03315 [Rubrivivax sp. JA1024]|nr:hypothetical protein [Rubrivivax sp. JA1024]